jgi:hypothetical protein
MKALGCCRFRGHRQQPRVLHRPVESAANNGHSAHLQMNFAPRLMRRQDPVADSATEIEELRRTLDAAPGVSMVKSIEPHRKGGYIATMDFHRASFAAFIDHIDAAGWMSVL